MRSNGNSRLRNKLVALMLFLALLIIGRGLYSKYMDGTFIIDPSLYNEVNYRKIIDNWDKLSESDLLQAYDNPNILWYYTTTSGNSPKDIIMLRRFPDGDGERYTEKEDSSIFDAFRYMVAASGKRYPETVGQGIYHRAGLIYAIHTPAAWGNCTSMIKAGNNDLIINAVFYDTDGTSKPLDTIFRDILDIVQDG